jgi:aspartate aminotransferase
MYLLEVALVACVGGAAFGDSNCFRISYAASEETLQKAVDRISNALAKLQ